MKSFLTILLAILFALPAASAQMDGVEIPLAIRKDFQLRHPGAEEVYWEPWERGFKASFYEQGLSKEQFFTAAGQPVYGCTYLEPYELPQAVQEFLRNRFAGNCMPSVVLRMERPNRSVLYRVHLDTQEGFLELVFDENGSLRGENLEAYQTGQN